MKRNAYIAAQREKLGRRAVAVLPIHYPKEIFTALGLLCVELWGPPGPPRGEAAGRLQSYVCALGRNALAFIAGGHADAVDALLFPHTCDTIQGMATLVADFGGWNKPVLTFHHPKGPPRGSGRRFVAEELRSLARALEPVAGRSLDPARLDEAVRLHQEIDQLRGSLLDARSHVALGDPELYEILRRGEWLWPREHLTELRAARAAVKDERVQQGTPVLVTGYVPEPMSLLAALNRAGAYVAADDYAAVGRRVVRACALTGDPWADVAARYWAAPPCSTRSADQPERMRYLGELFDRSGARGVLVHVPKFCEPELFDVPAIRAFFAKRSAPVLVLEGELEAELSAQATTRVEAFVEMLDAPRREP